METDKRIQKCMQACLGMETDSFAIAFFRKKSLKWSQTLRNQRKQFLSCKKTR